MRKSQKTNVFFFIEYNHVFPVKKLPFKEKSCKIAKHFISDTFLSFVFFLKVTVSRDGFGF